MWPDALSERGYEVIIYDQAHSAYVTDTQKMIIGDILDFKKVKEAVRGCDYVYNFAGLASIEDAPVTR